MRMLRWVCVFKGFLGDWCICICVYNTPAPHGSCDPWCCSQVNSYTFLLKWMQHLASMQSSVLSCAGLIGEPACSSDSPSVMIYSGRGAVRLEPRWFCSASAVCTPGPFIDVCSVVAPREASSCPGASPVALLDCGMLQARANASLCSLQASSFCFVLSGASRDMRQGLGRGHWEGRRWAGPPESSPGHSQPRPPGVTMRPAEDPVERSLNCRLVNRWRGCWSQLQPLSVGQFVTQQWRNWH